MGWLYGALPRNQSFNLKVSHAKCLCSWSLVFACNGYNISVFHGLYYKSNVKLGGFIWHYYLWSLLKNEIRLKNVSSVVSN